MLKGLHDRARHGRAHPERTWPEIDEPGPVALASRNPETQTVTLVLDTTTANAVMFAIAAHADEREAHIREVQSYAQTLPEGSYGRRNRQAIATRETRIAARLRAVEHAYRIGHRTRPLVQASRAYQRKTLSRGSGQTGSPRWSRAPVKPNQTITDTAAGWGSPEGHHDVHMIREELQIDSELL